MEVRSAGGALRPSWAKTDEPAHPLKPAEPVHRSHLRLLGEGILGSFAFVAGCLYPECLVPLLALNETVTCKARQSGGTPPEKDVA